MSRAAVKWAKGLELPFTEKAVLIEIAEAHSPRWGMSKRAQSTIAKNLGLARETVNRVLKRIEAKGHIRAIRMPRANGRWEQCAYVLNPHGDGIKSPPRRVTKDHMAPCDSRQTRHRVTEDHTYYKGNIRQLPIRKAGGCK